MKEYPLVIFDQKLAIPLYEIVSIEKDGQFHIAVKTRADNSYSVVYGTEDLRNEEFDYITKAIGDLLSKD